MATPLNYNVTNSSNIISTSGGNWGYIYPNYQTTVYYPSPPQPKERNSMSGVYEYLITEDVKSKDPVTDEVITKTNILIGPVVVTAKDADTARMIAIREIPADKDVDKVKVVVRPFD